MVADRAAQMLTHDAGAPGIVAAVRGDVLDADFAPDQLPPIGNALLVERGALPSLTVEVQARVSEGPVRCIALAPPVGLRRGLAVTDTGRPVTVPVGEATLGRVFHALGRPTDGGPRPRTSSGGRSSDAPRRWPTRRRPALRS
jgi:F-type H+-transporting ATPase subunit beta